MGRRCHGRIIPIADSTFKSLLGRLGLSQHPMTPLGAPATGVERLGSKESRGRGYAGLRLHDDGDAEQVAAGMGFDLVEGAYDLRWFIRVLDGRATSSATGQRR